MSHVIPNNRRRELGEDDFVVSKTDLKGKIIYGNKIFIELSGYQEKELLKQPHNIIRHPDMPGVVFKLLWERIKNQEEIFAYVKNLSKDGSYYWVYANVTATLEDGHVVDYYSVRRKPNEKALQVIEPLYRELVQKERSNGMDASQRHLNDVLASQKMSYDEFINFLQNGA